MKRLSAQDIAASRRRHARVEAEWEAEAAMREHTPTQDPRTCRHVVSYCPGMREGILTRVCMGCGIVVDSMNRPV